MRSTLAIIGLAILLLSCTTDGDCPEGINRLPMYGKVKKCKGQIEADSAFLKDCDNNFKNDRKQASRYFEARGWQYLYANKPDTAMFRFNQAWMLDSLNANVYWGFANIAGMKQKYKGSLPFFNRALQLNSTNPKLWKDASNSYGQLFSKTQDKKILDKAIQYLKMSLKYDATNADTYSQLTAAYTYFIQKDSAKKYLEITDRLNPNAINPQVRKLLSDN